MREDLILPSSNAVGLLCHGDLDKPNLECIPRKKDWSLHSSPMANNVECVVPNRRNYSMAMFYPKNFRTQLYLGSEPRSIAHGDLAAWTAASIY